MLFNPMHDRTVQGTTEAAHLASLDTEFGQAFQQRRDAATALASAHGAGDASAIQAARAPVPRGGRPHALAPQGRCRPGEARLRRRELHRRQLRLSDVHHDDHADGARRPDDRRHLRRGDVRDWRRAQRAGDGEPDRRLQALVEPGRHRPALPARVADRDGMLGAGRLHGRTLRRAPRVAHRSREPLRVVLLRLAARGVHARDWHEARDRHRRLRRPHRGDVARSPGSPCGCRRSRSSGTTSSGRRPSCWSGWP